MNKQSYQSSNYSWRRDEDDPAEYDDVAEGGEENMTEGSSEKKPKGEGKGNTGSGSSAEAKEKKGAINRVNRESRYTFFGVS
jgi:hypothetical protein